MDNIFLPETDREFEAFEAGRKVGYRDGYDEGTDDAEDLVMSMRLVESGVLD